MRTSNQVGRPSIFDGKTFLGVAGMPKRKIALVRTRLDDWLPEPFTVATRIVKSLARCGVMNEGYPPSRALPAKSGRGAACTTPLLPVAFTSRLPLAGH